MTPEQLAAAILRAAGNPSLNQYMPQTRAAIIAAARACIAEIEGR